MLGLKESKDKYEILMGAAGGIWGFSRSGFYGYGFGS
jgi:hypothetical protein